MESAVRAGIKAGVAFFFSDKWVNAAPFCREDDLYLFSRLMSPDLQALKFNILKLTVPTDIRKMAKIFTDCDRIVSTEKGIAFLQGGCLLFREKNVKEILMHGILSYIKELKEKLNYEPDLDMER